MARKDESTSLLRDATVWQIEVHVARLFPQTVIAAHRTDPLALDGLLSETLRDEARLTSRIERLPDDYDLDSGSFVRTIVDTNKIRLQASRYIARGLLPITYVLGTSPWSTRLECLVEDLCALAEPESPFSMGPVPSGDSEVNGNLLVALIWMGQEIRNISIWRTESGTRTVSELWPKMMGYLQEARIGPWIEPETQPFSGQWWVEHG